MIEISNRGRAFDGSARGYGDACDTAEDGRGIQLMRALVDKVEFTDRTALSGTVVRLEKALCWREGSPVRRLSDERRDGGQRGPPPVA